MKVEEFRAKVMELLNSGWPHREDVGRYTLLRVRDLAVLLLNWSDDPNNGKYFALALLEKQRPLGKEFEKVYYGNLPDLYVRSDKDES